MRFAILYPAVFHWTRSLLLSLASASFGKLFVVVLARTVLKMRVRTLCSQLGLEKFAII